MNPLSSDPLRQAEQAIHDGKINDARTILVDYIKRDPNYDRAWWLLTFTLTDLNQQIDCLKRVLQLNPKHAQAREWLAKLKKTGSLPPLKPTVSPFVTGSLSAPPEEKPEPPVFTSRRVETPPAGSMWPVPEQKPAPSVEETLFPTGQKTVPSAAAPVTPPPDTNPPVWTLPNEEKPEPPRPGDPAQGPQPKGKKPRKKNTWIVDVILVSTILCVAILAGAYYWFSQQGYSLLEYLQPTINVTYTTDTPAFTRTAIPSRTPTVTDTPAISLTPSETPTETPTLEYTLTPSAIPTNLIGPAISLYPPDFTLTDVISGQTVTLSDTRGQPTILFFWATTCSICKTDLLNLQAVYEKYATDGLLVLAINAGESSEVVTNFGLGNGLTIPLLLDPDKDIYRDYQVSKLPRYIFVGRNSRITLIENNSMDSGELEWQTKILLQMFPSQQTPTP
jgi:peroxiredoxin